MENIKESNQIRKIEFGFYSGTEKYLFKRKGE